MNNKKKWEPGSVRKIKVAKLTWDIRGYEIKKHEKWPNVSFTATNWTFKIRGSISSDGGVDSTAMLRTPPPIWEARWNLWVVAGRTRVLPFWPWNSSLIYGFYQALAYPTCIECIFTNQMSIYRIFSEYS